MTKIMWILLFKDISFDKYYIEMKFLLEVLLFQKSSELWPTLPTVVAMAMLQK